MSSAAVDVNVSMKTEISGFPKPQEVPETASTQNVQITVLPNGVRVASLDKKKNVSSLSFLFNAGSRYENSMTAGVSQMVEMLAYRGSTTISKLKMNRCMEEIAAHFGASSSREIMTFAAEGMRSTVPRMMKVLVEVSTRPFYFNWNKGEEYNELLVEEIGTLERVISHNATMMEHEPSAMVNEMLHAAAFEGNTLGLPLFATERSLQRVTPQVLAEHVASYLYGDHITISGVNIDHDELVGYANEHLGNLPKSSGALLQRAKYTGGDKRHSGSGMATCAIGFEGLTWTDKDLIPACVLHTLLGGGGSFSSGGPGKGMYTKLYTGVLNRNDWVLNATAFNHVYSDSGVFGIMASASPDMLPQLIELVANEAVSMTKNLDKVSVERAKNMTISSLLMSLESRGVLCEDIGRQVLASGTYETADQLIAQVKAVKGSDLERVAARVLQTKPSVAICGELYGTPSYSQISSYVKSNISIPA